MKNTHVYIIHGYMASPQSHWFPWLQEKLMPQGATVTILPMPDSSQPKASAWLSFLKEQVKSPSENTFFVAHSLGCITLLRYLQSLDTDSRIGGFVLVSGFSDALVNLPQLDEFTSGPLDYPRLIAMAPSRSVIVSLNDVIVPHQQTEHLSSLLQARLRTISNGGHFLASEGFTQLQEVYEDLNEMIKK